ncbi:MAG: LAGLIDADG family homing endonuclease [Patescibacteria group bacterium]|nr:LAGLIDADG family homing endonuclease [Patescibacteria group bacterium]
METQDLSYMAGYFDGEGSISLVKRQRGKCLEYFIRISIGQKDGASLDWIKDNFGGTLYNVKRDDSYIWLATNNKAYKVIKLIVPFLKYKQPQVKLAIKFYEECVVPVNRKKGMTPEDREKREKIFNEMKSLKHIFTKARGIGTTTERVNPQKGM